MNNIDKILVIGTPSQRVKEYDFYNMYLMMLNIKCDKYPPLTESQRKLLALIMSRPLDFTMIENAKDGKIIELAKELSLDGKDRSANSVYILLGKIKNHGYFTVTEDRHVVIKAHLQEVRSKIKSQIKKNGFANFDCLFKLQVS